MGVPRFGNRGYSAFWEWGVFRVREQRGVFRVLGTRGVPLFGNRGCSVFGNSGLLWHFASRDSFNKFARVGGISHERAVQRNSSTCVVSKSDLWLGLGCLSIEPVFVRTIGDKNRKGRTFFFVLFGLLQPAFTLVFTDAQSSTELWNKGKVASYVGGFGVTQSHPLKVAGRV